MISAFVMSKNLQVFQALAMGLFGGIYALMLIWIFRRNSTSFYKKLATMVVEDGHKGRAQ